MLPSATDLHALLDAHGARAAPWLQQQLGISQPSLSRVVARALLELPDLRRLGHGKSTLYALAAAPATVPVWRVDEQGAEQALGELHALVKAQWAFAPAALGTPTVTDGLPVWVAAMARDYAVQSGQPVPAAATDCVAWLAAGAHDLPGCLGLGHRQQRAPATPDNRQQAAPHRASGLHAERLSDLAVAEYLAASVLRAAQVPVGDCELRPLAAPLAGTATRWAMHWSRDDRVGECGRRARWTLQAAHPGLPAGLAEALQQLPRHSALGPGVAASLHWLVAFAACLGADLQTDQIAVAPAAAAAAHLPVPPWPGLPAPKSLTWRTPPQAKVVQVRGVFPRGYWPTPDGELPAAPLPAPGAAVPRAARTAAERYWRTVAKDVRVSFAFRLLAAANARHLEVRSPSA